MAITACVQPESGRIVYAGSDFPHPFQLRFSKEGVDHIVQNRPGSGLDGLVRVWSNASGPEASRCAGIIWSGFWQDATGPLPVPDFQTKFRSSTDVPDNIVQNQPGSDLVLVDCVRFWPNDPVRKQAAVCKNHPARFRPVLPSRSGLDANRIRHVYWVEFIGLPVTGRPGFIGVPLSERQAQPVTEGTMHLSINISLLPRVKYNIHARGRRHGVDSVHNHTHVHNNISRLTMYIL